MALAATTLALMLGPLRKQRAFHVPSAVEAQAAQRLFARAAMTAQDQHTAPDLDATARVLGLALGRLEAPAGLTLSEPDEECAGRGAYMFRSGEGLAPVAITAPHRGADRDTGPLAKLLFEEHRFAAAAWNTAPRRGTADCPLSADIARLPTHFLTAFSLAFAREYPAGRVVQLHGFDGENHPGSSARKADLILSDGSTRPAARLRKLAACLKRAFPGKQIRTFGIDADILGATANAQGRALRRVGFAGFTHLEMAPHFRSELVADGDARQRLGACLGTAR